MVSSAIHKLFSFEKKFDVSTTNSNVLSYDSDTSYTPEPEILLSLFAVDLVETVNQVSNWHYHEGLRKGLRSKR